MPYDAGCEPVNSLPRLVAPEIPLASGVTFRELLSWLYADTFFTDKRDRPLASNYAWRKLKGVWSGDYRAVPDGTRCVAGHFKARKYDRWGEDSVKAIWFRDPVDRLAAHSTRWKESPDMDNVWCKKLLDEELTLEQFGRLPVMQNLYATFLDGARLSTFHFVGIAEEYGLSLQLFRALLGPPAWPKIGLQMLNE